MAILFVFLCLLFQEPDVPLLSKDNFSYEMDYFLKEKPDNPNEAYNVSKRKDHGVMLAYVKIHFKFKDLPNSDRRIRVIRAGQLTKSQKIKHMPVKLTLDMGYAVDMKDRITPSSYVILVENSQKQPRAKVLVEVEENGRLLINHEFAGML